jgi:hypothetical protein
MPVRSRSFKDCLDRIAKVGKLSPERAADLLEEVARRAEEMRRTGKADPLVTAAAQLARKIKEDAKVRQKDALLNASINAGIMREVANNGGLPNAANTLYGLLHGHWKGLAGGAQGLWKGLAATWGAALDEALRRIPGATEAARSNVLDREIAKEVWAINAGEASGSSKNRLAVEIAQAIQPTMAMMRDRLNAAGADVRNALYYVTHTLHDAEKMRRAAGEAKTPDEAFRAWWAFTEPKLHEFTFRDLKVGKNETEAQARTRMGRSIFDAYITGVHMSADGGLGLPTDANGYVPSAYEGTQNIARKVSQHRILVWKDADGWHDYMQAFGQGNGLLERIHDSIERSARQVALMQMLGTNPKGNFNTIIRRIQETYREDVDGMRKFQSKVAGLEARMGWLDGSNSLPSNAGFARFGGATRSGIVSSFLGGVGLTHLVSIWPTVPSELAAHGINRFEAVSNMVQALVKGKGSEEKVRILSELGAYADGSMRHIRAQFDPNDYPVPGVMSWLANQTLKWSGIHYVFDHTKAGVRSLLSHNLAANLGKPFDQLDPKLANMLRRYRVHEGDWELMRTLNPRLVDGLHYLTPEDVMRIDRSQVEHLLRSRGVIAPEAFGENVTGPVVEHYLRDLQDSLITYFTDSAQRSIVTPGIRERALLMGATKPGSIQGEFMRFFTQFKMWPVAAFDQTLRKDIFTSLDRPGLAWNVGALIAFSTVFGYMRMLINDLLVGRPPRDPRNPATLLAAAAQGGGTGILGDFLFGQTNRFGGGLIPTIGGPLAGDADTLIQMWNRFRTDSWNTDIPVHPKGRFNDLWPDLAHFFVRHIPYANLVWTKGALDYLLWYHLYEAASPGWWERTNRRLQREQGRTMAGYVPGGGVPYTPPPFNQLTAGNLFNLPQ